MASRSMKSKPLVIVPWRQCQQCWDDFCFLHHAHVHDCDCPTLDVWIESGLDPLAPVQLRLVLAFLTIYGISTVNLRTVSAASEAASRAH